MTLLTSSFFVALHRDRRVTFRFQHTPLIGEALEAVDRLVELQERVRSLEGRMGELGDGAERACRRRE